MEMLEDFKISPFALIDSVVCGNGAKRYEVIFTVEYFGDAYPEECSIFLC